MASLRIHLDDRRIKSDRTYPIVIRLIHQRKSFNISLDISVRKKDWDHINCLVRRTRPNYKLLNHNIRKQFYEYENKLLKFELQYDHYNFEMVKKAILKSSPSKLTFAAFGEQQVYLLKQAERIGTAMTYQSVINSVAKFRSSKKIDFIEIDFDFLLRYESYLFKTGFTKNGVASYFRTLRAIYNKAVKSEIVDDSFYPFKKYSIKTEKTKSRALTEEQVKQIEFLHLMERSDLWHYQNYFMLSFNLIGISFIDMAFLKFEMIHDGRLSYKRRKTGKIYNIKLTQKALSIINFYGSEKRFIGYILPVIKEHHNWTAEITYERIRYRLRVYNDGLIQIARLCDINSRISSYSSRYSWANIAKKMGYGKDMIAEALGHEYGNPVTGIYLDNFEKEEIDLMNEEVTR